MDGGVVAVVRLPGDVDLVQLAQALLAGGVVGFEVTMGNPKALKRIEEVADALGDKCVVGVGTVLDAGTAAEAIHAGAEFVVSPVFDGKIVETTRRWGKLSMPGAFTPTEVFGAWNAGADVVKLYPGNIGGPAYLQELLAPMPFLRLMPSVGVEAGNVGEWMKAGAVMVYAADTLVLKEAVKKKDWGAITARAREFVEGVKAARGK
jgi:2-dehydro-3-deoxyphosphogluconate aldolase/(4S)-4-hydroxy-2-oxoglutarate aldolase